MTLPPSLDPYARMLEYVIRFPLKRYPPVFRAYFERGGYRDCKTFQEALQASSPTRGAVTHVDQIDRQLLWSRTKEKP